VITISGVVYRAIFRKNDWGREHGLRGQREPDVKLEAEEVEVLPSVAIISLVTNCQIGAIKNYITRC
jgi:hypothetical protein